MSSLREGGDWRIGYRGLLFLWRWEGVRGWKGLMSEVDVLMEKGVSLGVVSRPYKEQGE